MKTRIIPKCREELYIIVEGYTEEALIKKLKGLYEVKYDIKIINARSGYNIVDKYRSIKRIYPYTEVLVLYDLDNKKTIKDIIKIFQKVDIEIGKKDIYFINPFVELLFVLCKEKKALTSTKKRQYARHIKRLYKIDNYHATEEQVNKILGKLKKEDFDTMQKNISEIINLNDNVLPSTNFVELMIKLFKI